MGILDGLFGGGGGSPYDLYGDLFSEKQRAALRDREMGQGLLRMAGALADAAKPTLLPGGGIGSAIGKAAAAMGAGGEEAMNQQLKGMQIAEQVKQTRQERAILAQALPIVQRIAQATGIPVADLLKAGGVPSAPAPTTPASPDAPPASPDAAPAPAGPGLPSRFGLGTRPDRSQYGFPARPGAASPGLLPMPPAPPGGRITPADYGVPDDPGAGAGLGPLAPPDQLVAQNAPEEGLLARIAAMQQGGGAGGARLPFQLASAAVPGAGGDDAVGSGGGDPARMEADLALVRKYESGNRNIMQNVVGPQGGYNPSVGRVTGPSSAGGYYQMIDSTWRSAAGKAGIDTEKYPRAIDAPPEAQHAAAQALYQDRGLADWAPYNRALARATGYQGASASGEGSGGGAAPAPGGGAAPSGGGELIPGTGVTPQALAALNAMLKLGGIKSDPFGSLLDTYYKSPGYLGEKARTEAQATKDVGLKMDPLIEEQNTRARLRAEIDLKPKLEEAVGRVMSPILKQREEAKADIDRFTEQLRQAGVAGTNIQDATILGDDGKRVTTKMTALEIAIRQKAIADRRAAGDVTVRPGDIVGTEVLTEEQKADIKSSRDIVTVTLTPPGATRPQEMQVTGAQARAIAEGRAVPSLGIPAMSGIKIGKPVYNPTEAALGPVEAKAIFENHQLATDAATTIETNKEARSLLDSGVITGFGADRVTAFTKLGNALGITGRTSQEQVANTESYLATTAGNVGRMIKQFGAGTGLSDADREYAAQMAAGRVSLDETSIRRILDINDRASLNIINRHNQRVSKIAPGATMTDLNVPVPTPYKPPERSTAEPAGGFKEGQILDYPDGSQRQLKGNEWVVTKPPRS